MSGFDWIFFEANTPDKHVAKARRGLERHSLQSLSFAWSPPLFHSIFHGQVWPTPLSAGVGNNAPIHAGPVWPLVPRTLTDGITYLFHISLFTQTGKSGFSPGVSPALCTQRERECWRGWKIRIQESIYLILNFLLPRLNYELLVKKKENETFVSQLNNFVKISNRQWIHF